MEISDSPISNKKGGHPARRGPTEMEPPSVPAIGHQSSSSRVTVEGRVTHTLCLPSTENTYSTAFAAAGEWPPTPVVIFFLSLSFQCRRAVIKMYVSAAWVPLVIVSVKSSVPCPWYRPLVYIQTARDRERNRSCEAGPSSGRISVVGRLVPSQRVEHIVVVIKKCECKSPDPPEEKKYLYLESDAV